MKSQKLATYIVVVFALLLFLPQSISAESGQKVGQLASVAPEADNSDDEKSANVPAVGGSSAKEKADEYFRAGKKDPLQYKEALAAYLRYLNGPGGQDAEAWSHAAMSAARLGEPVLSANAYRNAARLYRTGLEASLCISSANFEANVHDPCLQSALETCRLYPGEPRAFLLLGYCHHKYGEYKEAIAAYSDALKKGGASITSRLPEELAGPPAAPRIYALRAQCYYKIGDFRTSIDDCTKVIELRPANVQAREARAEALIKLNDYEHAAADLEKAVQLKSNRARTYKQLGLCQMQLGKNSEAQASLTKAIEIFPKYAEAFELRSKALENLGMAAASQTDARKALKLGLIE